MARGEWRAERDGQVPEDLSRLLGTVPEWFGRDEENGEYINAARSKETWTVRDPSGRVVGVTLVDRHFPRAVKIHLKSLKDFVAEHPVDYERVEGCKERMLSDAHAYRHLEWPGRGALPQAPLARRDGVDPRPN